MLLFLFRAKGMAVENITMMTPAPRRIAIALSAILMLTTMLPLPAQDIPQPEDPEPDAGTFQYSGSTVIYKIARTRTTSYTINPNNVWVNLPLGVLDYRVPVGTRRLFNVSFSGECSKATSGQVRIRVIDNVGVSPLEPNDQGRILCSGGNQVNTNTAIWVKTAFPGLHTLRVQILKTPATPAVIDDWTFELVVHNP